MIKDTFKNIEKLYHFTSFQTAMKIIESGALKFGRLSSMNDIHENDKLVLKDYSGQGKNIFNREWLDAIYDEIYKYRQLSFSMDKENKFGFDLHQMWGLYADKGNGVCLVFDKELICKRCGANMFYDQVSYDRQVNSSFISCAVPNDIGNEIHSQVKQIFFHKRNEWEHEQEFRVLKRCEVYNREAHFRFGNSLKFIIVTSSLREVDEILYFKNIEVLKAKSVVPVLVYGNGLLEYSLCTSDGEEQIWSDEVGYKDNTCKYAITSR